MVPSRVAENKLDVLNAEVKPFFAKLKETGAKDKEYNDYVAGYFTALASEFNKKGDKARASACLDKALKYSPDYKDALALKATMSGTAAPAAAAPAAAAPAASTAGAWIPTPFVASTAFAKLKNDIVPSYVEKNQLKGLGVEAKAFFDKLVASGVKGADLNGYKVGYYNAIAEGLMKKNDNARAKYYLDHSLALVPADKEALALKARLPADTTASK